MAISTDSEGFLTNYLDWAPESVSELAMAEGIELVAAHWEVIYLAREYYARFHISPVTRVLSKIVGEKLGAKKAKSIYLMRLFTAKPAKIVSKLAGLPKPSNCD
jgi:tRNA 2-thiouridine synthesizing protein E